MSSPKRLSNSKDEKLKRPAIASYDMPTDQQGRPDVETYIHRIGRTGRFGRQGLSINFVYDRKSFETMEAIEKELKRPIVKVGTEDFDVMEKVSFLDGRLFLETTILLTTV